MAAKDCNSSACTAGVITNRLRRHRFSSRRVPVPPGKPEVIAIHVHLCASCGKLRACHESPCWLSEQIRELADLDFRTLECEIRWLIEIGLREERAGFGLPDRSEQ